MGPECHVIGVFIRGKETQRQTRDGKTMQAHRANAVEAEVCRDASTRQGKPRSATTTTSRKRPEASPCGAFRERTWPDQHLDFALLASRTGFLLW